MAEILEANKIEPPSNTSNISNTNDDDDDDDVGSLARDWNNLVGDIATTGGAVSYDQSPAHSQSMSEAGNSPLAAGKGVYNQNINDTSDSFELSEADLEVGTYAARLSKEKTIERQRRMSDTGMSSGGRGSASGRGGVKSSVSPVRSGSASGTGGGGKKSDMQMSQALSSIDQGKCSRSCSVV